MSGNIEVITGCMFSGKTEKLLDRLEEEKEKEKNSILFKPGLKNNYMEKKIEDDKGRSRNTILIPISKLSYKTLSSHISEEDIIAIENSHFFDENIVDIVKKLAINGYTIIISGLDQNFRGEAYKSICKLMAFADDVHKLSSECVVCGGKATKTQRLINGEPIVSSQADDILVEEEYYEPRCRNCHVS